jgi:hypothetical protein
LDFRFLNKNRRKIANKAKYFWIFQTSNRKKRTKQTKGRKLKRQTKRNNGNIFGLFMFWKAEIKARSNKVERK